MRSRHSSQVETSRWARRGTLPPAAGHSFHCGLFAQIDQPGLSRVRLYDRV